MSAISAQTPEEARLGVFSNWTAALTCAYVEEKFGISFSSRGMLNLFERLGLSYTRPTYTLEKADPKKQEQFRETFEILKKLLEGVISMILFEDESMIWDYQAIMKTWFPKGKPRIIPTYGKIVIILDNAKIHHAKLLKEFLEENRNRLELVFLPSYSPHLNKIEEF